MASAAPPCLMTTAATRHRASWGRTWRLSGLLLQVRWTEPGRDRTGRRGWGELFLLDLGGNVLWVACWSRLRDRGCGVSCKLRKHTALTCAFCCPKALSPCAVTSTLPDWHIPMEIVPDSTSDLYNFQVSPMPSTSEGSCCWGLACLPDCSGLGKGFLVEKRCSELQSRWQQAREQRKGARGCILI